MRIKRVYFSSSLVFAQVRSFFPLWSFTLSTMVTRICCGQPKHTVAVEITPRKQYMNSVDCTMTRVNRTLCTNGQIRGTQVNFLSSVKFDQFDDEERIRQNFL